MGYFTLISIKKVNHFLIYQGIMFNFYVKHFYFFSIFMRYFEFRRPLIHLNFVSNVQVS